MSLMGELNYFLGLQIKQMADGIYLSQNKYIKELLKKFEINEGKTITTPMASSSSLDKAEHAKDVDQKLYRGIIRLLLYLTASRPNILYSECVCARFQSAPKEPHLIAAKRILRYLRSTTNLSLFYPKNSEFDLVGFADADFGGCKIDRKSTSGTCFFLGNALVAWLSIKNNTIALSTTEAEYVSLGSCYAQISWIK